MPGSFLLINNAAKPFDELIKTVAPEKGTTEAALTAFEEGKLHETIVKGLKCAEKRSAELSGS